MHQNQLSDNWIFQNHEKEEVLNWVHQLAFFYFIRAIGGHANDGDQFVSRIKFHSTEDLKFKLNKLDLNRLIITVEHDEDVFLESTRQSIENEICFVSIHKDIIEFSVFGNSGNIYEVGDVDFNRCKKLEVIFSKLNFQVDKDYELENSINCICLKKYPKLFS